MERKKRLIILSIIVSCLALVVVLSSALFKFRSVSIECRTTCSIISDSDYQGIMDSGNFNFGKNILFQNFDENIKNIEKAYPYVKVINIEIKFPDYAVINIRERTPAVRLSCSGGVYCLDEELKVLNVIKSDSDYNKVMCEDKTPYVRINSSKIGDYLKDVKIGEFLQNELLQKYVSCIYNGIVTTEDLAGVKTARSCISMISEIVLEYEEVLKCTKITLKFYGDARIIEVYETEDKEKLTDNIYKVFHVYIGKTDGGNTVFKCSPDGIITAE